MLFAKSFSAAALILSLLAPVARGQDTDTTTPPPTPPVPAPAVAVGVTPPPSAVGVVPPATAPTKVTATFVRTESIEMDLNGSVLVNFQPPASMGIPGGTKVDGVAQPSGAALSPGNIYQKIEFSAGKVVIPANTRIEKDSTVPAILIPPPPIPRVKLGGIEYELSTPPPAQAVRSELNSTQERLQALEQRMVAMRAAIAPDGEIDKRISAAEKRANQYTDTKVCEAENRLLQSVDAKINATRQAQQPATFAITWTADCVIDTLGRRCRVGYATDGKRFWEDPQTGVANLYP